MAKWGTVTGSGMPACRGLAHLQANHCDGPRRRVHGNRRRRLDDRRPGLGQRNDRHPVEDRATRVRSTRLKKSGKTTRELRSIQFDFVWPPARVPPSHVGPRHAW